MADTSSDYVLGISYLLDSHIWHGVLTLSFIVVPSIKFSLLGAIALKLFNFKMRVISILLKFPFLCMLPTPIIFAILYYKERKLSSRSGKELRNDLLERLTRRMVLLEVFLESIPQLCLQAYIMITIQGYGTTLQYISCTISLLAACFRTTHEFNNITYKCIVFF